MALGMTLSPLSWAASVEIRGHVLRNERPVRDALIRVIGHRGADDLAVEIARGTTDSEGRFGVRIPWDELENEPAGRLLEVTAPRAAPRVVELDDRRLWGPGAGDHLGAIRLDRQCIVEGTLEAGPDRLGRGSKLVLWREGLDRPAAEVRLKRSRGLDELHARFPPVECGPYTLGLSRGDGVVERLGPVVATESGRPRHWRASPLSWARGRVVDEQGEPIRGASIRALAPAPSGADAGWLASKATRSDSTGAFRVAFATTGPWILEVGRAGFETSQTTRERPPMGRGETSEIEVSLCSSARLAGRITRADDPDLEIHLPGAEVTVTPILGTAEARSVRSNSDGEFRTSTLSPGEHRVTVTAKGHVPVERTVSVDSSATAAAQMHVTLAPEGTASLRVEVTADGDVPIGNAQVWIEHEESKLQITTYLGSDGTTTIAGVPTDVELSVGVYHSWHEPFRALRHRIDRDGAVVRVSLPAPPWHLVPAHGVVTDPSGRPVADVRIEAFLLNQHSGLSYYAVTDPQGRFTVGPMPEGAYWVRTVAEGFAESVTGLKVAPREPTHRVILYPGTTLTGRFPGARADGTWRVFADRLGERDDRESYQLTISFRGYPSETTYGRVFDGGYRIELLPPGRWIVVAEREEGEVGVDRVEYRAVVEVASSDRSVALDLEPFDDGLEPLEIPVVGRLFDSDTGAALAGVEVRTGRLMYIDASGTLAQPTALSDANGDFALEPGLTLPLQLFFHRDGYARSEALVTRETAAEAVEVALEPTPGLDYRVEWFDGAEVILHTMTLENEAGEHISNDGLDYRAATGHWRSAPRGRHVLEVEHGWGVARLPVEIPGPEAHIVLPPTGMAALRVPDLELEMADGWLEGVTVTATPIGEPADRSPVTERSVYYLSLPPGRWRIDVSAPDGRSWSAEREIRDRRVTTFHFRG